MSEPRKLLRRGDGFGRLGVGMPYMPQAYESWRWWSWLLIGGLREGDGFLNSHRVPGEMPIPLSHNALIREFVVHRPELDTLLLIEYDHEADQDIVERMRTKEANWDFDIICANYITRRGMPAAVGLPFGRDEAGEIDINEYGEVSCVIDPLAVWRQGTQPTEVTAMGLLFVRRWVLEAMMGDVAPDEYFWCDWRGRNSQDINFSYKAHGAGARIGVDRDNALIHWGRKGYTIEDYWEFWDGILAKIEAEKQQEDSTDGGI